MRSKYFINIFIICLIMSLAFSTTEASRKKKVKPPQKEIIIKHTKYFINPYLTGGWIIGQGADYIESNKKALYGLGTTFIYQLKPKWGGFGNFDVVYGNVGESNITKYRVISFSGGLIYTLTPHKRSSVYFKGEYGYSKIRATFAEDDYGTHPFIKFGLGSRIYSSPTIATVIEIYYKRVFNNDNIQFYLSQGTIDGEYIGALFSVSFGL